MRISDCSSDVCSSDLLFQLTTADYGIEDFAVSPNGSEIAFSQNNEDGTADLWVLNVLTNAPRPVTNCVVAVCRDRKSVGSGKVESVRVDIGGRCLINNKKKPTTYILYNIKLSN